IRRYQNHALKRTGITAHRLKLKRDMALARCGQATGAQRSEILKLQHFREDGFHPFLKSFTVSALKIQNISHGTSRGNGTEHLSANFGENRKTKTLLIKYENTLAQAIQDRRQ